MTKPRKNFRERYAKAAQSEWFKKAYDNRSIGDVMGLESYSDTNKTE